MVTITGTNGPDNYIGSSLADTINGRGGNDTLNGRGGNDYIYGDLGDDSLYSGAGHNFMFGGGGNDTLNAVESAFDDLFGGIGDDLYIVRAMGDNVVEGFYEGIDTVETSNSYSLDANVENLVLMGEIAANGTGNALDNDISGNSNTNNLSGGDGNDNIYAAGGKNDTLNGEAGYDVLTGGGGNDQFVFNTALPAGGIDIITNFTVADNDKIVLDKTVFSALETAAGNPLTAGDFLVINVDTPSEVAVAGNSVNEIVYNRKTHNLFYNPNNNVAGFGPDGGQFANVYGNLTGFSNTAFLVVP
jgi:Ca2+-binding RTX toxin-like protein